MWYFIIAFIFFWMGFFLCAVLAINKQPFDPWNYQHPETLDKDMDYDNKAK